MELPEGYSDSAIKEILKIAHKDVEEEYGYFELPHSVEAEIFDRCKGVAKGYNPQVAYEEAKGEMISFLMRGF
jgi:hypothetical protein